MHKIIHEDVEEVLDEIFQKPQKIYYIRIT